MKKKAKIGFPTVVVAALSLSVHAGVIVTVSPVGAATDFPSKPIHAGIGTLGADTINTSGAAGMTMAGGVSQGIPAGTVIGEVFKWSGGSGNLNSIVLVMTGSGGKGAYQVCLLDLGTGTFFTGAQQFSPINHTNLFNAGDIITVTNETSVKSFMELDFSGTDMVTLQTGHSYAFGLVSTSDISDLYLERSNGAASDPYGLGFTADSLRAKNANASPFAGSVRNVFLGVYSTPLAEPTISMATMPHDGWASQASTVLSETPNGS